jgi:hypothetical protein
MRPFFCARSVGDLYWSLALLSAWCAGDSCAGTRKINGQMRCLELESDWDWACGSWGQGRLRCGFAGRREVKVAGLA